MPKRAKELSPLEVGRLKEPGLHFVGGVPGLALQVTPGGSRSWVLRYISPVGSKRREMGLGPFSQGGITLADARVKAKEARDLVTKGVDPIADAERAKAANLAAGIAARTFAQCADAYIEAHSAGWKNAKHGQQWRNTLAQYAHPVMGKLLARDVNQDHVLAVLEPIWKEKNETATRLRNRIELVLDWATARGYRQGANPARWRGHLDKLLAKPSKVAKVRHHPAVQLDDAAKFMAALRAVPGMGARALEFAAITAARSAEVRGATWAEINLLSATWTVPAGRMKGSREHRVSLSSAAVALLKALPRLDGTDLVFPGAKGRQLSDMTLGMVMRRLAFKDKDGRLAVPHGLRSTFKDWATERTDYPNEMVEMALSHAIGNKVEAAYRRGDMFDKRRALMSEWAAFLARPTPDA